MLLWRWRIHAQGTWLLQYRVLLPSPRERILALYPGTSASELDQRRHARPEPGGRGCKHKRPASGEKLIRLVINSAGQPGPTAALKQRGPGSYLVGGKACARSDAVDCCSPLCLPLLSLHRSLLAYALEYGNSIRAAHVRGVISAPGCRSSHEPAEYRARCTPHLPDLWRARYATPESPGRW